MTNLVAWAPGASEKQAANGPGPVGDRTAAEKFYFLGQTNAAGQLETITLLGSNATHATATLGSSATANGLYADIIVRQCDRAGAFFDNELHKLELEGDDTTDDAIDRISA